MVKLNSADPQSALEYDDRTTEAVKSVLVEIGQILGSFKGKFAIVGGAVPWLLLNNKDMPHVGRVDVDVVLNAEALADGEYSTLVGALLGKGYHQRELLRRFQLVRQIETLDGGDPIEIIVDFLMPRNAEIIKNIPPLISNFAVQRADGAELAVRFHQMLQISGRMPTGGTNRVDIAVCSIPALLAMKGYALDGRLKQKDAYDIYYCIRNYPEGPEALANDCLSILEHESALKGYRFIEVKFETPDSFGPNCVRRFVEGTQILGERSPDQWQQDAFGQIDLWLRALGLRK